MALVDEAFIGLVGGIPPPWQGRRYFFLAGAMGQFIVDFRIAVAIQRSLTTVTFHAVGNEFVDII